MSSLIPRTDVEFKLYNFTPDQELRAKLLSPETIAYYEHAATEIATQLCNFVFSSDPQELADQIKSFVSMKAHRDCLLGLLNDCQVAYAQLAGNSNPNQLGA
jgi:hypothetical protein